MKLDCFVILPSNNDGHPVTLVADDRWGLAELPSDVKGKPADAIQLNFDVVYKNIISKGVAAVEVERGGAPITIECKRATELNLAGDIIPQVIKGTCRAEIVIADLTCGNPNVFLELGIRLVANNRLNILLCHEHVKLPFDVQHERVIPYRTDDLAAADKASKIITETITNFLEPDAVAPLAVVEDRFKRYFDTYTGRKHDRELVDAYADAPRLVSDLASFLFTEKLQPTLKPRLFEFINGVQKVLENDPEGNTRAVEFLETVCGIDGLSEEKLSELFYSLWKICDADDSLKDRAKYWMKKMENL